MGLTFSDQFIIHSKVAQSVQKYYFKLLVCNLDKIGPYHGHFFFFFTLGTFWKIWGSVIRTFVVMT